MWYDVIFYIIYVVIAIAASIIAVYCVKKHSARRRDTVRQQRRERLEQHAAQNAHQDDRNLRNLERAIRQPPYYYYLQSGRQLPTVHQEHDQQQQQQSEHVYHEAQHPYADIRPRDYPAGAADVQPRNTYPLAPPPPVYISSTIAEVWASDSDSNSDSD